MSRFVFPDGYPKPRKSFEVKEVLGGLTSLNSLSSCECMTSPMTRCSIIFPSFSVSHRPLMSEDNSSFELVDFPVMVFPADMISTPEKPVQSWTSNNQKPDPAEDPTATAKEPDIEEVKVWGMAVELGKEKLNSEEKTEEPKLIEMEGKLIDKLQKHELEGRSSANGGLGLRTPWARSWREHAFVVVGLSIVWVLYRG